MTRASNAERVESSTEPTRRGVLRAAGATLAAGTTLASAAAGTAGAAESASSTTARAASRRPSVESLTADADYFFWYAVGVDWSVADRDGDLAGVETCLYDGRELIGVEYTDCGGHRAAGTHTLDFGWAEDPTRVVLTVIDETKGTNTAEVTV